MSDLTAFPMDSQVTGMGDDGLPIYDRAFDSTDLREVYKTYFSDGYFAEVGTSMHVKAAGGMTATVERGKVNIQGTLGFMDDDATVTFAAAGSAARVDTVVARLDLSVEKRVIELDVLTGEEGVMTAPSLTRDSTVWELGLADVTIPASSAAVSDTNIKDTRLDTTRCGVVEPFAKLDTDSLFAQVTAIITKAGEDTAANIERLESEVDAAIADGRVRIDNEVAELDKATADAVSAMNDALSSTVLGSVWRLGSSSSADYLVYGDDLNNIANVCTRFCESASIASGIANKPDEASGAFVVYTIATEHDPTRLGQMLLTVDAEGVKQFVRSGAGNSWTAWSAVGGVDQTARDAAAAAQTTADGAQAAAAAAQAAADGAAEMSGWIKLAEGAPSVGGSLPVVVDFDDLEYTYYSDFMLRVVQSIRGESFRASAVYKGVRSGERITLTMPESGYETSDNSYYSSIYMLNIKIISATETLSLAENPTVPTGNMGAYSYTTSLKNNAVTQSVTYHGYNSSAVKFYLYGRAPQFK